MVDLRSYRKISPSAAFLLVTAMLWTLIYWSIVALMGHEQPRVHTWKVDVQFVFSGAQRGQYPNGMPFAPSDLLSPVVVDRALASIDDLPAEVDSERVAEKLSVAAWFPGLSELRQRYRERLGSDLSVAELNELETSFFQEFERGARSRARLYLTSTDEDFPAAAILEALPQAWAGYMKHEYGAFTRNRELVRMDALAVGAPATKDVFLGYLRLREQLNLLTRNIAELEAEPNSGGVRAAQSGLRLADVSARAAQLEEMVLESYLNRVLEAGLTENPEQMRQFLTARLRALQRRVNVLDSQASAVANALREHGAAGGAAQPLTADGALLGGGQDFLNRLIRLGAEGGDVEFRQELTRQRLAIDAESARLGSEISRMRQLMGREDWSEALLAGESDEIRRGNGLNAGDLHASMLAVEETIGSLFSVLENIAEQMDRIRFGTDEAMFSLSDLSVEPEWSSKAMGRGSLQWYFRSLLAVLLMSGMLLLMIYAFTRYNQSGSE